MFTTPATPDRSATRFIDHIDHPDLWIWDAWTCFARGKVHMYCLALAKSHEGQPISPASRNQFQFHIRHFSKLLPDGEWVDCGPFLLPSTSGDRNVWSGSVLPYKSGVLAAYTDVRWNKPDMPFVQSICIGWSSSFNAYAGLPAHRVSDPVRDYDQIRALGYYLAEPNLLGSKEGEEGGPILAWRDPFLFEEDGVLQAIWCAKTAPSTPALAHATISVGKHGEIQAQLRPPIELPDSEQYTQAELPKIWNDETTGKWFLLVSACNRQHENQPDERVRKDLRLYSSQSVTGPWRPWAANGSTLDAPRYGFGASPYFEPDNPGKPRFVVPFTEQAQATRILTMQSDVVINLRSNAHAEAIGV